MPNNPQNQSALEGSDVPDANVVMQQDEYALPEAYQFGSTIKRTRLPGRRVTATNEQDFKVDEQDRVPVQESLIPKKFPTPKRIYEPEYSMFDYFGVGLVDVDSTIQRGQYQTAEESQIILAEMGADERIRVLKQIETYGFYGPRTAGNRSEVVGNGLGVQDISAFRRLLIDSNSRGRTYNGTLLDMSFEPFTPLASSGPRIRYTPKEDVQSNFRKVFLSDVGRSATDAEVKKFVDAYRSMETKAGTEQNAPSIQAATEQSTSANNKAEKESYGLMQGVQVLQQILRGG